MSYAHNVRLKAIKRQVKAIPNNKIYNANGEECMYAKLNNHWKLVPVNSVGLNT